SDRVDRIPARPEIFGAAPAEARGIAAYPNDRRAGAVALFPVDELEIEVEVAIELEVCELRVRGSRHRREHHEQDRSDPRAHQSSPPPKEYAARHDVRPGIANTNRFRIDTRSASSFSRLRA